jgi:N-methylhydantoinase B/oxoprolinase/acetone carboxylase alpha subunit
MATAPVTDFSSAIVDRLGDIKAQIADLKKIEAELVQRLIDSDSDAIDGRFYRATVSQVAERQSLDVKAAEAKLRDLGVDGRWFSKNQKTTKGYTTVKVVARKA